MGKLPIVKTTVISLQTSIAFTPQTTKGPSFRRAFLWLVSKRGKKAGIYSVIKTHRSNNINPFVGLGYDDI